MTITIFPTPNPTLTSKTFQTGVAFYPSAKCEFFKDSPGVDYPVSFPQFIKKHANVLNDPECVEPFRVRDECQVMCGCDSIFTWGTQGYTGPTDFSMFDSYFFEDLCSTATSRACAVGCGMGYAVGAHYFNDEPGYYADGDVDNPDAAYAGNHRHYPFGNYPSLNQAEKTTCSDWCDPQQENYLNVMYKSEYSSFWSNRGSFTPSGPDGADWPISLGSLTQHQPAPASIRLAASATPGSRSTSGLVREYQMGYWIWQADDNLQDYFSKASKHSQTPGEGLAQCLKGCEFRYKALDDKTSWKVAAGIGITVAIVAAVVVALACTKRKKSTVPYTEE